MTDKRSNPALEALRRNVTGKIERGEAEAITEMPPPEVEAEYRRTLALRAPVGWNGRDDGGRFGDR